MNNLIVGGLFLSFVGLCLTLVTYVVRVTTESDPTYIMSRTELVIFGVSLALIIGCLFA